MVLSLLCAACHRPVESLWGDEGICFSSLVATKKQLPVEIKSRFKMNLPDQKWSGFGLVRTNASGEVLIELRSFGFSAALIWMHEQKAKVYIPSRKSLFEGSISDQLPFGGINLTMKDFSSMILGGGLVTSDWVLQERIKNKAIYQDRRSEDFTGEINVKLCKVIFMKQWPTKNHQVKFEYPERWRQDFPKSLKWKNGDFSVEWANQSYNKAIEDKKLNFSVPSNTEVYALKDLKNLK